MRKPFSRYCAGAYEHRFDSWRNDLEAFIEYVNEGPQEAETSVVPLPDRPPSAPVAVVPPESRPTTSRTISWRLRFLVFRRDNFKCRACGDSPALHPGLVLHADHVVPWSKDGETALDNLQTLCEQCNIGKSDLAMSEAHQGQPQH